MSRVWHKANQVFVFTQMQQFEPELCEQYQSAKSADTYDDMADLIRQKFAEVYTALQRAGYVSSEAQMTYVADKIEKELRYHRDEEYQFAEATRMAQELALKYLPGNVAPPHIPEVSLVIRGASKLAKSQSDALNIAFGKGNWEIVPE